MNQRQYENWTKLRKKGMNNFIWFRGVLLWGILNGLLWLGLMEFISPSQNIIQRAIIALIMFPLGGYFWGKWVWKITEKRHFEYKSAHQEN